MSGMLAIINASEADYQSLTQSIYNSAGAAQRMANIKLDNLAGDLTLLQSATDGLSLSIGEQFMPQARGLVQAGTSVITFVNELIDQHPVLTKVVLGAAGAVGVLTAGVVAYNAAQSVMAALNLTALFTGPVGPILAVGAALGAVVGGVIAFVNAANEGIPKVDELTQAAQSAGEAMGTVAADFDSSRVNIAATADVAGLYIDRLDELGAKTSLTSSESTEYHNILQLLCETVPDLAESIDLTTDSIEGGTEALRAQTEAWQKNAEAQAYQEAYQNLMGEYNAVLVEQAENSLRLTESQTRLQRAEEKRAALLDEIARMEADGSWRENEDKTEYYYDLGRQVNALNDEISKGEKTVDAYQEALGLSSSAAEEAKAAAEGYGQAMASLTGESQNAAGATRDIEAELLPLGTRIEEISQEAQDLADAYSEAYSSAYTSIQGQYALWDQAAEVAAVSAGDINAALESQVSYWQNYNSNLENLRARAGDVQGLGDVIASFADGSAESVNAVAGLASATDEELAKMVANWQAVQAEEDAASENIAEMATDFTSEMDRLGQELQADVEAMDFSRESGEAARATIQSFINQAAGMLDQVQAAYSRIGSAAGNALRSSLQNAVPQNLRSTIDLNGYAAGTTDAEPGFAMVGENGPELVFFQGGEQVVNAAQTAAIQRQSALSATPAGGYGGEPMVIQIYFQFEGSATPEAVAQLREYGAEFEARVRQVMEEYTLDSARRRY